MKIPIALVLVGCAAQASGCAQNATPHQISALSPDNQRGNAGKIASFVEQQCFDRASNLDDFEAALVASGWKARRTQKADPAKTLELDVWELPNAQLIRGQLVTNQVWTCAVNVQAPVAPTLAQLRLALSEVAGRATGGAGEWWWNRTLTRRMHMTADSNSGAAGRGIFINVEIYHVPWWHSILG